MLLKLFIYQSPEKEILDSITIVTLCGNNHLFMLKESLHSLTKSWLQLPRIKIYTDGSISTEKLRNHFKWLDKSTEFLSWETALNNLNQKDDAYLVAFAHKHVIGRKLAVITSNARKGLTLWCDADIIWFKPLNIDSTGIFHQQFYLKTSSDFQPAYSDFLMDAELSKPPFVNTGLVLHKGNLFDQLSFKVELEAIINQPDHFSEQTIVAKAVHDARRITAEGTG